MKKTLILVFCCLLGYFGGSNLTANASNDGISNTTQIEIIENDLLETLAPGEVKTFDIFDVYGNERAPIAMVDFFLSSDTRTLNWVITPLTVYALTFNGNLSQTNLDSGFSCGSPAVSGLIGMQATCGYANSRMLAQLDGVLTSLGVVAPFPKPSALMWTNKR